MSGGLSLEDLERSILAGDQDRDWRRKLRARPAGTQRAYGSRLRVFDRWMAQRFPDVDPEQPKDQHVALHLVHEFRQGRTGAVLRLSVTSLRWRAKVLDQPSPIGFRTQDALDTLLRESARIGRTKRRAPSLSESEVDRLIRQAESAVVPWGLRDGALIAACFYGTLRASEALALDIQDIRFQPNGEAALRIRRSKTDQHGEGRNVTLIPTAADRLRRWTDFAEIQTGPVFRSIHRLPYGDYQIRSKRLCFNTFHGLLAYRAIQAGLGRVSTHTLRRSSARALMERGATVAEIQLAGGWKSGSMAIHYASNPEAQGAVMRKYFSVAPKLKAVR